MRTATAAASAVASGFLVVVAAAQGCEPGTYYAGVDLEGTSAELIQRLNSLIRDHTVIPYTSASTDVWDALRVLDPGSTVGTVNLVYGAIDVNQDQNVGKWNREHLWPKSYGVGEDGPDYSDLHHLRPSDVEVNAARGNLFFDDCLASCTTPAHPEAEAGSARDTVRFMPPIQDRGEIARAMFYMAVRYDGTEPKTNNLVLTDCPVSSKSQLGLWSTLVKWHTEDPVSEAERTRNGLVCSQFQGNRNPFVDHPVLVDRIFGAANYVDTGCGQTPPPSASEQTPPPSASEQTPPPSASSGTVTALGPGDIVLVGVNTGGLKTFALLVTRDVQLEPGVRLALTDNAWLGTGFRSGEGLIVAGPSTSQLRAGQVLVVDPENLSDGATMSGPFALSTRGDSIVLFASKDPSAALQGKAAKAFVTAFTNANSAWDAPSPDMTTSQCALPPGLAEGLNVVSLDHADNVVYRGVSKGTREVLLRSIANSSNWAASDTAPFNLTTLSFQFVALDEETPGGSTNGASCHGTLAGTVLAAACALAFVGDFVH